MHGRADSTPGQWHQVLWVSPFPLLLHPGHSLHQGLHHTHHLLLLLPLPRASRHPRLLLSLALPLRGRQCRGLRGAGAGVGIARQQVVQQAVTGVPLCCEAVEVLLLVVVMLAVVVLVLLVVSLQVHQQPALVLGLVPAARVWAGLG